MKAADKLILVVLVGFCLAGCVEREMTITSEPSGALVFISDQEVGNCIQNMVAVGDRLGDHLPGCIGSV